MSASAITALSHPAEPSPETPDHEAFRPLEVDTPISTEPADARRNAAQAVGRHIAEQLRAGRSLFNVVHDAVVRERIGADGRATAVRMQAVEAEA